MAEEFELRLTYSAATIYVRKVTNSNFKKRDDPTTTSNPVELTESDDDYSANESGSSACNQVQWPYITTITYIPSYSTYSPYSRILHIRTTTRQRLHMVDRAYNCRLFFY